MKLYTSAATPFGRKVQIVLLEKNIPFELELDNIQAPTPKIEPLNPLRKLPVLQLDNGQVLIDSTVICEYLDALQPLPLFTPIDAEQRLQVRTLDVVAQGILDASVLIVLEPRFHEPAHVSAAWITHQTNKIEKGFAYLSAQLANQPYLTGDAFTIADITLGCALAYVEFRQPQIDWRSKYTNLIGLFDRLMTRESFIQSVPKAV